MSGKGPGAQADAAPPDASRLEIRVLGPIEVSWDSQPVDIGGVKARALVARLLVDRNLVVSADALADSLWGEQDGNAGQIALRSTISRLRKRIRAAGGPEDLIVTRAPGYLLAVPADVTDAHRFERLVAAGRQALRDRRFSEAVRLLAEAESIWRGPAYREVCDEPFARAEARRLDELRLSAIETRIDAELTLGRHAALAGELESLTSRHPLRERLWSQRMLSLYRSGRQAEALRVFQELRDILVDELGIDPGHDVMWMEHAILAQDPALDFPVPAEAGTGPARTSAPPASAATYGFRALQVLYDTPFVGRKQESTQLRSWWEAVKAGDWRLLLVDGEAGVGKTRLVVELARAIEDEGAAVLWGRCDEDAVIPFQPLAEALSRYYETQSADQISAMPEWQLSELSRLVPRLRDYAPPYEEGSDPGGERYRFFEAVTETLRELVAQRNLLLVIDDAHRIDQPTLLLLRHVLRGAAGPGFGFVGILVDTDLHQGDPLWPRLADARSFDRLESVHLEGLDATGVEELTKTWTTAPLELVPQLCELTDGNPLFLQELLRQYHDHDGAFGPAGQPLVPPELTPTEAIRELVARRVSRQPEDVIYLLRAAAVAGREFEATVVAEAADLTAGQMLDAFDRAEESRLLRPAGGATGERYAFTHGLVRDAIYQELLRGRRVRYHHKIAVSTEQAHAGELDDYVNELAYHYYMGAALADADRALHYCVAAGERAMRLLAFEEAVEHFGRGLEVVERFGPPDPGTRSDVLLALAEAENLAGDREAAERSLAHAAALARKMGDAERLATVALRACPPSYLGRVTPDARQAALLQEAISAMPEEDSPLRAMALARLGQVVVPDPGMSPLDALKRSRAMNTEAVAMARRLGDPGVLGFVLSARMQVLWGVAPARERLATSIEIGEIAEETADERLRMQGCVWRVRELLVIGAIDAIKEELAGLEGEVTGPVDPLETSFRQSTAALMALLNGDIDEATRAARRFFEESQAFGEYAQAIYVALMWWTWWQQGGLASPHHEMRSLLGTAYSEPASTAVGWALVHAEAKETAAALERLEALSDAGWPDAHADVTEGITLAVAAAACSSLGAPVADLGNRVYEALRPFAGSAIVVRGPAIGCAGPADQYLGQLAVLRGDLALAEVHFEAALHLARHMQAAPFVVAAEVELARVLRRRRPDGEAERIAVLLRDAEESALAMGLHRLASLAAEPG